MKKSKYVKIGVLSAAGSLFVTLVDSSCKLSNISKLALLDGVSGAYEVYLMSGSKCIAKIGGGVA